MNINSKLQKAANIKSKDDLFSRIKWILLQSKSIIPVLIFIIIVNSLISLIGVYSAIVSKNLINSAIGLDKNSVIKWLIIMASIMITSILISQVTSLASTHASTKLNQELQKKFYDHITNTKWIEESSYHSVSLLTRLTADVGTISSMLISTIPNIVSLVVTLISSFSVLMFLAPSIALIALILGPVLAVISKVFAGKLKRVYQEMQETDIHYRSFMQETLQNIIIVKTFCMEHINMHRLKDIQQNKYNLAMKNAKLSAKSNILFRLSTYVAYICIFAWGAINIATGVTTYGTFTAMLQLYSSIQYPISQLASTFPSIVSALAASDRLIELEKLNLEERPVEAIEYIYNKPSISFNDVSFEYKSGYPILKNLNLNIPAGETIAFVGPSGEGKTTLIRLILSLIQPTTGKILISENGCDEEININHRDLISYVPQGNTLFSGTIEENLRYGNYEATIDEINEALKMACAYDFVNDLKYGIKTVLGEKGYGISEGQAQRLSIARALLRKRPILILDEATYSLDPESEVNVLKAIKTLPNKPTCIIITHRPSALNICSRILKLEDGHLRSVTKESILEIATELS